MDTTLDTKAEKRKLNEERKKINSVVNFANDGKNTERVVDFIIEKANLKL